MKKSKNKIQYDDEYYSPKNLKTKSIYTINNSKI